MHNRLLRCAPCLIEAAAVCRAAAGLRDRPAEGQACCARVAQREAECARLKHEGWPESNRPSIALVPRGICGCPHLCKEL